MNIEEVVNYFKILSDETRVKIVSFLKNGTMCACEILEKLHITQPTLSYHMKILSENDLVTFEKKGKWVNYTINEKKFNELSQFLLFDLHNCKDKTCSCTSKS